MVCRIACCLILFALSAGAQAGKATASLAEYLGMATAKDFRPLTQRERNSLYLKSFINPWGYARIVFSGGLDQWNDKPSEWEQGASGYGKRVAHLAGQYAVHKTFTFAMSSALHEDNRYFASGEQGIWRRARYAVLSSVLARNDNGKLRPSVSEIGGTAAGAFAARLWLPASQSSAGDGAVSFGISMAGNAATSVLKEFLPDLFRRIAPKPKTPVQSP